MLKSDVISQVCNIFRFIGENDLIRVLEKQNYDFVKTVMHIEKNLKYTPEGGMIEEEVINICPNRHQRRIENERALALETQKLDEERRKRNDERKILIDRAVEIKKCEMRGYGAYECPIDMDIFLRSEVILCSKGHAVCKGEFVC
jgi:hypothetical protein